MTSRSSFVALVVRPTLCGAAVVAAIATPSVLLAAGPVFPREVVPSLCTGVAAAFCTALLGNGLIARGVIDSAPGTGFVRGVVLDFALQLGTLVLGMAGMFLAAMKFPCTAALVVTFVAAATIFRVTGSAVIVRALDARRAVSHPTASPGPVPQDLQS